MNTGEADYAGGEDLLEQLIAPRGGPSLNIDNVLRGGQYAFHEEVSPISYDDLIGGGGERERSGEEEGILV